MPQNDYDYKLLVAENEKYLWYISSFGQLFRADNPHKLKTSYQMTQIDGTVIKGNLVWTIDGKPFVAKNLMARRFLNVAPMSCIRLIDRSNPKNVGIKNLLVVVRSGDEAPRSKPVIIVDRGIFKRYPSASAAAADLYCTLPTLLNHLSGKNTCLAKAGREIRWGR